MINDTLTRMWTQALSRGAQFVAETPIPVALREPILKTFGNTFGVNWQELDQEVQTFETFEQFFCRGLPEGARPIESDPVAITSPCDGAVHSCVPIERGRLYQIKGRDYSLEEFLGPWADRGHLYEGGTALTIYLRPKDYHHVHAPFDCAVEEGCVVPGTLWPVNPWANRSVRDLYSRNERVGMALRPATQNLDAPVLYFMVGALMVGGIETVFCYRPKKPWSGKLGSPVEKKKGEELGQFYYGSTVIMLYPASAKIDFDLEIEQELRLGQRIGTWTHTSNS